METSNADGRYRMLLIDGTLTRVPIEEEAPTTSWSGDLTDDAGKHESCDCLGGDTSSEE